MGNNINLIRDRAESPPTPMEKLSPTLLFVLFAVYAVTLGLALIIIRSYRMETERALSRADSIEQRIEGHDFEAEKDTVDEKTFERFQTIQKIIGLHESRWEWNQMLEAVQENTPESVFLTSFRGRIGERVEIKGYADDAEGKGRRRVRNLIDGLENAPLFMHDLSEVTLESSRRRTGPAGMEEVIEFTVRCPGRDTSN